MINFNPLLSPQISTYLLQTRLPRPSPNTKYKTLKLLTLLTTPGGGLTSRTFKIECQRNAELIRECQRFQGPPDPLRGDEYFKRVRDQAGECLVAIFSDDGSATGGNVASTVVMEGMGSNGLSFIEQQRQEEEYKKMSGGKHSQVQAANASMNNNNNSNNSNNSNNGSYRSAESSYHDPISGQLRPRMEGIGSDSSYNPNAPPVKDLSQRMESIISTAKSGIKGILKDPLAKNMGFNKALQPPGRDEVSRTSGGDWNMASNRSGAYSSNRNSGAFASSGFSITNVSSPAKSVKEEQVNSSVPSTRSRNVKSGVATSDGAYEKSLILSLCPPSGLRPTLDPLKLSSFLTVITTLDVDLVSTTILNLINSENHYMTKGKALSVIEAILKRSDEAETMDTLGEEASEAYGCYSDFFHECKEEIRRCSKDEKAGVRIVAGRVLKLLGEEGSVVASPEPVAVEKAKKVEVAIVKEEEVEVEEMIVEVNLLDFDDDSMMNFDNDEVSRVSAPSAPIPKSAPPPPPSLPPPPPPAPVVSQDLFGRMNTSSRSSPVTPITPATAAAQDQDDGDMFSGMQTKNASPSPSLQSSSSPSSSSSSSLSPAPTKVQALPPLTPAPAPAPVVLPPLTPAPAPAPVIAPAPTPVIAPFDVFSTSHDEPLIGGTPIQQQNNQSPNNQSPTIPITPPRSTIDERVKSPASESKQGMGMYGVRTDEFGSINYRSNKNERSSDIFGDLSIKDGVVGGGGGEQQASSAQLQKQQDQTSTSAFDFIGGEEAGQGQGQWRNGGGCAGDEFDPVARRQNANANANNNTNMNNNGGNQQQMNMNMNNNNNNNNMGNMTQQQMQQMIMQQQQQMQQMMMNQQQQNRGNGGYINNNQHQQGFQQQNQQQNQRNGNGMVFGNSMGSMSGGLVKKEIAVVENDGGKARGQNTMAFDFVRDAFK